MIRNGTSDIYIFGSTTWQLNNPGSIRYSDLTQRMGATGADPRGIAYFPDYATGRAALYAYMFVKSYRTYQIADFFRAAYPYEQGFDPIEMTAVAISATNVPDTVMLESLSEAQRQTMMDAIQKYHGWFPDKASNRKRLSPGQYL